MKSKDKTANTVIIDTKALREKLRGGATRENLVLDETLKIYEKQVLTPSEVCIDDEPVKIYQRGQLH